MLKKKILRITHYSILNFEERNKLRQNTDRNLFRVTRKKKKKKKKKDKRFLYTTLHRLTCKTRRITQEALFFHDIPSPFPLSFSLCPSATESRSSNYRDN